MKRILITGANSYIGTSFESYLSVYGDEYAIDTVDMTLPSWREKDFGEYDAVFHVAGIAHSDNGKLTEEKKALYYSVNTDLTVEAAKKAKTDGAKQFVFMSSAIVYGDSARIGKTKHITPETPLAPKNSYGDSKVQAEKGIMPLSDDFFKVVILRPPMIYGKGSKGNYPFLSKIARKIPLFPQVNNQRSMIYIENFCEFVRLMIDNGEDGIFWPQNAEYVNTCNLVQTIAAVHGRKVIAVKGFGWALKILSLFTGFVNKAFGSLTYDTEMSKYKTEYRKISFVQSIEKTEAP